jgi:hypothetical protein
MSAIRTLLRESIDYAGLFPPAGLDLPDAVRNYANYKGGPDAWALGRFVVPVSRLGEFETAAAAHLQHSPSDRPWQLSVLGGADLAADIETVTEFNHRHSGPHASRVAADTLEVKASSKSDVEDAMRTVPRGMQAFVEVPIAPDPGELLKEIARHEGRAKIRTGGVTRDAFPTTADLLRFMKCCVQIGLAFKATAGLHHPLRAEYRLTYAPDSPKGTMFGFLNLFLATAFLRGGMPDSDVSQLLEEKSPETFQVDGLGIGWRNHRLDLEALRVARREGMISFGSCSFTEPLGDLELLGLLPARARLA